MKKNFLSFIFSLVFFFGAVAADTTRVLFIGNSFTYFNNMPQMVKAFADSAHIQVLTGMHAPGGISVGDTAQGTMAHMNNPALFALIRSKKWDFVVIQDNQGRFILDSAVFPGKSKVVQGHLNIMDSVKANNSCAKIILFGGWAWKNGMPPYGNTGIESIDRILINYCVLNDTMKEVIAPIGEAWIKAVKYLPAVNLWDPDDAHPSYAGSYLTASVIFSTIFNLPAVSLNYDGTLGSPNASALRAFADSSVFGLNFHTRYNLGGIKKLNLNYSNGQLSVPGNYTAYAWYKNKVYAGNSPTLTLQGNGVYMALVKETDGCLIKTCEYSELTTGVPEENMAGLLIYPNPSSTGSVYISCDKEIKQVELLNIPGTREKVILEKDAGGIYLCTSGLRAGSYLLVITLKDQVIRKKVMIGD